MTTVAETALKIQEESDQLRKVAEMLARMPELSELKPAFQIVTIHKMQSMFVAIPGTDLWIRCLLKGTGQDGQALKVTEQEVITLLCSATQVTQLSFDLGWTFINPDEI